LEINFKDGQVLVLETENTKLVPNIDWEACNFGGNGKLFTEGVEFLLEFRFISQSPFFDLLFCQINQLKDEGQKT
jgi:hypothetical protein